MVKTCSFLINAMGQQVCPDPGTRPQRSQIRLWSAKKAGSTLGQHSHWIQCL